MPTYDYRCGACGHEFEVFQQMTEPVKRKCPKCGKSKLERLIGTGAGIIFKGGGFYQTDYRSDNYKKSAEADGKSSAPPTEAASSQSDTKTESKSESKTESRSESKSESKSNAKSETKPAASSSTKKKTKSKD